MRVYIDAPIHRWKNQNWCHVFSPDIDALHLFCASIGMKRKWFQDPHSMPKVSWPHYDTNAKRRLIALEAGAISVGRHQTVAMSKVIKNRFYGLVGTEKEIDPILPYRQRQSPLADKLDKWIQSELRIIDRHKSLL